VAVLRFTLPAAPQALPSFNIRRGIPTHTSVTTDHRSLEWLDALKGIAIIAVVLDHAFIVDNYEVWKHLYFHVSWFIFLTGVANAYSAQVRGFTSWSEILAMWWRRISKLVPPYAAASALAFIFVYAGRQSITSFGKDLLLFHTLPPLYFIALLLQLLVAFPIIFLVWQRYGWIGRIIVCVASIIFAQLLSQFVTFPWVLGAHYLLGGSFLYLFVLGIAIQPMLTNKQFSPLFWVVIGLPILVAAEWVNLISDGDLMTHPPTFLQIAYSLGSVLLCYAVCQLLAGRLPIRFLSRIGRRSLDIFAYHYLLILPVLQFRHAEWTHQLPFVQGQLLLMAIAVPLAIAGSILIGRCFSALADSTRCSPKGALVLSVQKGALLKAEGE
jgi:peptidoglycan/LPS O-acetylase OafA/YrhL